MVMRNDEHYADPTPGQVIETMEKPEPDPLKAEDTERMERSLAIAKSAFKLAGFEVVGRIVLRNVRTGRIYR